MKQAEELKTSDITYFIPEFQSDQALLNRLSDIENVKKVEQRSALFLSGTVKKFRNTDFSMNLIFYNIDEQHELNNIVIEQELAQNETGSENYIYLPRYFIDFGMFNVNDEFVFVSDDTTYSFTIAGIVDEMQYGNYATGLIGVYVPDNIFQQLKKRIEVAGIISGQLSSTSSFSDVEGANEKVFGSYWENIYSKQISELSFIVDDKNNVTGTNEIIQINMDAESISQILCVIAEDAMQSRLLVSNLVIAILVSFSIIVFLVSTILSRFRIRNSIEEKIYSMGVLKAIGFTSWMIIVGVVFPYCLIAFISSLAGIGISYLCLPFFANILAQQSAFTFNEYFDIRLASWIAIVFSIITFLFTLITASKIRFIKPVEALRGLKPGEKTNVIAFPLDKSPLSINISLVMKRIVSSKKQSVLLFMVTACVMVMVSFAGSLFFNIVIEPDNFSHTVSDEIPDLIVSSNDDEIPSALRKMAGVERVLNYTTQFVRVEGKKVPVFVCENYSMTVNNLCYRGKNPSEPDEICLGSFYENLYSVGDVVTLTDNDSSAAFCIVGFIQSLNYQGKVCEITDDGYKRLNTKFSPNSFYLYVADDLTSEIYNKIESLYSERITDVINYKKVSEETESMYSQLVTGVSIAILVISIIIMLLILYIIIHAQLLQQRQELGIYKALGYSNSQLTIQVAASYQPVSILAIALSVVLSRWYIPWLYHLLFSLAGIINNQFEYSSITVGCLGVWQICINLFLCLYLMRPIKEISAYELLRD